MRLLEGGLAVVLHPAVLAEEGGGETQRQPELEGEAVDAGGEQHRHSGALGPPPEQKPSELAMSWLRAEMVCVRKTRTQPGERLGKLPSTFFKHALQSPQTFLNLIP